PHHLVDGTKLGRPMLVTRETHQQAEPIDPIREHPGQHHLRQVIHDRIIAAISRGPSLSNSTDFSSHTKSFTALRCNTFSYNGSSTVPRANGVTATTDACGEPPLRIRPMICSNRAGLPTIPKNTTTGATCRLSPRSTADVASITRQV